MAHQGVFIEATPGPLYAIYHQPERGPVQRQVLMVQPFAEELNKSRRMLTLQARALAAQGIASLIIDLHGCGDSAGDLKDASWAGWRDNLATALDWLRQRHQAPVSILALRLGALLAIDAQRCGLLPGIEQWLLWQPVSQGRGFVQQFLRLRLAAGAMAGDGAQETMAQLREHLANGGELEVAGYTLPASLVSDIESASAEWRAPGALGAVHWLEIAAKTRSTLSPAGRQAVARWGELGVPIAGHPVAGASFWQTQEIATVAPLLALTTGLLTAGEAIVSREQGGG